MIFEAIINNNLAKVKDLVESGAVNPLDFQSAVFEGKDGQICRRSEPKTVLDVAKSLKRDEIVEYLGSKLAQE